MAIRHVETDILIDAPPSRIWAILMDFAAMPTWNPFITAISGDPTEGGRLTVRVAPPGRSAMRFRPTITRLRPEQELRWSGHLVVPGVFDGEHYFLLEPLGNGGTRFVQGERFSGLLVPLLAGVFPATEAGFRAMNTALKEQAEGGLAGTGAPRP